MAVITKDLGAVSSYALAVENGYTGTEQEWIALISSTTTSAQTAVDAKDAALVAKTAAETAATQAAGSATAAASSASGASGSASAAADSATAAAGSATSAGSSATAAAGSATAAAGSASSASSSATAASGSATAASGSATTAETAKTAAQTAQAGAEAAQAAAEAVLESIPEDYSEMSADVSALKSQIDAFYVVGETQNINTWEQGYIKSANGLNGSGNDYCRTPNPIIINASTVRIAVASGLNFNCFEYTTSNTGSYTQRVVANATGTVQAELTAGRYYRFSINKIDGSDLLVANVPANAVSYTPVERTDKSLSISGAAADAKVTGDAVANVADILRSVHFDFPVTWTSGGFLNSSGNVTQNENYEYTDYIPMFPGSKIDVAVYAVGTSDFGLFFYDSEKNLVPNSGLHFSGGMRTIEVPETARFARLSNRLTFTDKVLRNHVDDADGSINYYVVDYDTPNYNQTLRQFAPKTERVEHKYTGEVAPQKRFVTFGFDDLRDSDVDLIMPLFAKYGMTATFNRVVKSGLQSPSDERGIKQVLCGDHELGDHTFLHYSFPYFNPLWNGQDPSAPDGSQTPCPTNADFREEYANGKNKFGFALTDIVDVSGSGISNVAWEDLTDAQCQTLRNNFSVMKNSALIQILDYLSNKYLGTTGNSAGSWSNGEYTGGIFTGMKTSENHEVWERIQTIMQIALKEMYGVNYEMQTWSRPGSMVFPNFYDGTSYYYDSAFSIPSSPQSKIMSSLYESETGAAKDRSWTDVLREFGYRITHDYPNNLRYVFAGSQFYVNENGRKKDCVPSPSDYNISYSVLRTEYPETFFTSGKTKAAQMYDATGTFRSYIETIRNRCANGAIPSEMIDSYDTYSFRVFFENLLRFCQQEGFELIPKAEAFDVCFNHSITAGNLLYNPQLKNSAADFFTDATNVPTNPDGYAGTCVVRQDEVPVLVTSGETIYTHYGIPCGDLAFKCKAKGTGTIKVYAFRNNDQVNGSLIGYDLLDTVSVASANEFSDCASNFTIEDASMEAYDRVYEGYAQKIVGIKIVFSSGLEIKKQDLRLN